jgi:hypothetical protein
MDRRARALLCGVVVAWAAAAHAGVDVWRWIPSDTRVVVEFDPAAQGQARAREVLGVDALATRFATPPRFAKLQQVTVAYVPGAGAAQPVAFAHGGTPLASAFARLRGKELAIESGRTLFAVRSASGAAALLESECVAEGPQSALTLVLQHAAQAARTLAAVEPESARRLLRGPGGEAAPVSLVYVAANGGADLFAVVEDLDRVLGSDLAPGLAAYQKPLQMLGLTHAVRLDLRQQGSDLDTTLWLAMPNRMAAQIASVSLDASRDIVRGAARSAVRGGSMTATDAKLLEEALATLQTQADGDLVRVAVRIPDGPTPAP